MDCYIYNMEYAKDPDTKVYNAMNLFKELTRQPILVACEPDFRDEISKQSIVLENVAKKAYDEGDIDDELLEDFQEAIHEFHLILGDLYHHPSWRE